MLKIGGQLHEPEYRLDLGPIEAVNVVHYYDDAIPFFRENGLNSLAQLVQINGCECLTGLLNALSRRYLNYTTEREGERCKESPVLP